MRAREFGAECASRAFRCAFVALTLLGLTLAARELRAVEPVPELEWTLNEYQATSEPLPEAASEAQWTCNPAPGVPHAPIGRLRIERKLRFWASVGPRPQLDGARALLSVRSLASGEHGPLLACGTEFGLDLEPGEYAIYGSERLTRTTSYNAVRPGAGFAYRVSEPGDRHCPKALAAFGISVMAHSVSAACKRPHPVQSPSPPPRPRTSSSSGFWSRRARPLIRSRLRCACRPC